LLVAAKELFAKLFTRRVAIRHVGVSVTNLDADRRQNELFDTDANRRWYLNREVDRVRGRYGWNAVFCGKVPGTPRALRHQKEWPGVVYPVFVAINMASAVAIVVADL
jgi:hypothetical protein